MDHSSIWIFIAFILLAIALCVGLIVWLYDYIAPIMSAHKGAVGDFLERIFTRRRSRHSDDDDDEESEDLDDATATLLSMLPASTIVVDDDDEVIRANPQAYRLGIVDDDAIVNDQIRQAIATVREQGSRIALEITTQTPQRFVLDDQDDQLTGVDRPNWLKIIVGRISEQFVVVLIEDISTQVRFAQIRDDFIENVSQQLVEPVEQLSELADALEHQEQSREQIIERARQVRRSSKYVDHMVEDLLLLMKAQEPIVPSQSNIISLCEQMNIVVQELQPIAAQANITLDVRAQEDLHVHADDSQIQTAIKKLVENAMEYSPSPSTVHVVLTTSQDAQHAVIRVIDQGTGIAESEQSRIFERFFRGSNQNERAYDGVGLGLAIVKHVALTHHGSATVWSRVGQGSTFSLILPLAQ